MTSPFLEVQSLQAGYDSRLVLKGISFTLSPGSMTGLLGENGCGKTTLLKAIANLLPYKGDCLLQGRSLKHRSTREMSRCISYIPQKSSLTMSLPVLDVVLMGFNPVLGLLEHPHAHQRQAALDALKTVGMEEFARRDFSTLSEGQKQLCIFARTLVEHAPLLLLDEPDSALDLRRRYEALLFLKKQVEHQDRAGLVCLHDPQLALQVCDQLLLLKDGVCIHILHPKTDPLNQMQEALSQLYGPVILHPAGTALCVLPMLESGR
jgi:iron complex transport system ATP-binding protein